MSSSARRPSCSDACKSACKSIEKSRRNLRGEVSAPTSASFPIAPDGSVTAGAPRCAPDPSVWSVSRRRCVAVERVGIAAYRRRRDAIDVIVRGVWEELLVRRGDVELRGEVRGDRGWISDEVAERMTARPNVALTTIDDAGHDVHLDNPGSFVAAFEEFLDRAQEQSASSSVCEEEGRQ
jgi:pimeloyl-ACP methyl ester carboxylesterase